ncbi:MAG: T9SS type A sorting domain-containing protein, partial [Ignavibacteriota bacterium]
GVPDGLWDPGTSIDSTGEYIFIFNSPYDPNGNQQEFKGNFPASSVVWADLKGYTIPNDASATPEQKAIALSPYFNNLYAVSVEKKDQNSTFTTGDKFIFPVKLYPYSSQDVFEFTTSKNGALTDEQQRALFEKINVFPNPLYGYNPYTAYNGLAADDPFVTFTNLPNEEMTVKVYSLSGQLLRTLVKDPNSTSPFLNWDLQNEAGLRVASGLYLAIVSSPKYGDKVLKFSIIMPQKQLPRF